MSDTSGDALDTIKIKYDTDTELWNGRFSQVYRIKGKQEVLKIIKQARDMDDVYRERDILQKLKGKSNVVQLLRSDTEGCSGDPYYVMVFERCDLGTLNDIFVRKADNFPPDLSIELMISQISKGLNHLHEMNLQHGNLHPGNILLRSEGLSDRLSNFHLRLIPFGLHGLQPVCVLSGFRCSEDGNRRNRHPNDADDTCFVPPDEIHTQKSDMFSFGVIICSLFNRHIDFNNTLVAYFGNRRFADVQDEELTEKSLYRYTNSSMMAPILAKLLKKDPEMRPSAKEVYSSVYVLPVSRLFHAIF